jgi:hypothetical protein
VSNIIREWRAELDDGFADGMRELALALRKLRLTVPECALGAIVASTLKSIGVHENDLFSYLAESVSLLRNIIVPGNIIGT